jgi:hypothetical protein
MTAPSPATTPENALLDLAARLRAEDTVISAHVREPDEEPALGLLAAAGPRAARTPAEYSFVIEAIFEGYLLHYGKPRVLDAVDGDLSLLAGDYLYALGLERLAALGDTDAVRELADLISLQAQVHAGAGDGGAGDAIEGPGSTAFETAAALWLASTVAVTAGGGHAHDVAKEALRRREPEAAARLHQVASDTAAEAAVEDAFRRCAQALIT